MSRFRAIVGRRLGEFFLPNIDFIALTDALNVNPRPSPEALERLADLDLAPSVDFERLAETGIANYHQAGLIAEQVVAYHGDRTVARDLLREAHAIVRWDSSGTLKNQALLALGGIGFTRLDWAMPADHEVWRGLTVAVYRERTAHWHRWFAWLDRADYGKTCGGFGASLRKPGQINVDEAILRNIDDAVRPNLSKVDPRWRDPLRLADVPQEVWLLGMLAGLAVMLRREPWLAVAFAVIPAVQLVCMLRIGFSSPRYFQPMLPVYIVSGAVALQALASGLARRVAAPSGRRGPPLLTHVACLCYSAVERPRRSSRWLAHVRHRRSYT